jgi:hypothetical protein
MKEEVYQGKAVLMSAVSPVKNPEWKIMENFPDSRRISTRNNLIHDRP